MRQFRSVFVLTTTLAMLQLIGFPNQKANEAQAHCRAWHPHHCTIREVVDDVGRTVDRWGLAAANPSLIPVSGYLESLLQQGNGRWQTLPDDFKACYREHYSFNLDDVRFATNVNTIHGQGITVDSQIYFPRDINLSDRVDRHWMLHELEHVRQYQVVGGVSAFLVKYVVQGGIEVGRNGSINIHDNIGLEREADSKADRILDACSKTSSQPVASHASLVRAPVFDASFYLASHGDLRNAFGSNQESARNHWLSNGIREGRRSSPAFDVQYYLGSYRDLQNAFGANNYAAAVNHWLNNGIREGRRSSLVFDVQYYLGRYPDLQNAFGRNNYAAATNHWLSNGIREGRQGSADFDPRFYLSNNPDVARALGTNNYQGAITHYLTNGRREGRRGTP